MTESRRRLDAEYVLPLKWTADDGIDELSDYLAELAGWLDVTVVDGSAPEIFAALAAKSGADDLATMMPIPSSFDTICPPAAMISASIPARRLVADAETMYV